MAQSLTADQITTAILESANNFTKAIACEPSEAKASDIAALTPYGKDDDGFPTGKFAVFWRGDLGCSGGSGSSRPHVLMVQQAPFDTFVVTPNRSEPVIQFPTPAESIFRIVGNTKSSVVLEGGTYGSGSIHCCQIKIRFTMKLNEDGNWALANKREIGRID